MAQSNKRSGQLRLRSPRPDDLADMTPLPIYHHPLVAISTILIVASIGQIAVWLIRMRLVNSPPLASSAAVVHGWLYEIFIDYMSLWFEYAPNLDTIIFLALLGIGLLTSLIWYAAIRLAFGPAWGLTAALAWAIHPGIALIVQKPISLTLVILLLPLCLALLFWWKVSRHRLWIAPLVGVALAITSLAGSIGLLTLPVTIIAMCFADKKAMKRILSALICLAVYSLIVVTWWSHILTEPQRIQLHYKAGYDVWSSVATGETPIAVAAERWLATHSRDKVPSAARFLLNEVRTSPITILRWLGSRSWQVIAATSDNRFKRPLLVLQVLTFLPAVWGCIVALRYAPWRWVALVGLTMIMLAWLLAAVAEPLTRNLAPIAGLGLAFTFIGSADGSARIFGRRLTADRGKR